MEPRFQGSAWSQDGTVVWVTLSLNACCLLSRSENIYFTSTCANFVSENVLEKHDEF